MKLQEVREQLHAYEQAFSQFIAASHMPKALFRSPDHFAIKCADEADYLETCQAFAGEIIDGSMWELPEGGRLLASAQLAGKTSLAGHEFGWVEIMQPRPGKETVKGFIEHTEFHAVDYAAAEQMLRRWRVAYDPDGNSGHKWLNVVIDDEGREIKFNNRPLVDVLAYEQEHEMLRPVKLGVGE